MNLNKAIIAGRLTADPQLRSTTTGQQVASFAIATNRVWTDKAGAKQEAAEFHNIVVWGRQAEIVSKFLTKGALALVEGRLQTRNWQDAQGVKHWKTEVVADSVQFGPRANYSSNVGGSSSNNASGGAPSTIDKPLAPPELPVIEVEEDIKAEDLPF